jgi:hypothetical protein
LPTTLAPIAALLNDFAFQSFPLRAGNALLIPIRKITAAVEKVTLVGPLDNRPGAVATVSEMAMCRLAEGSVEIELTVRDNFGTAVTLALMLLVRLAPLWHRFVPHCFLHGKAHHRQRSIELRADERLYLPMGGVAGSPLTSYDP